MSDTTAQLDLTCRRGITWPQGFKAAGGTCGIKASGKPDLVLIVADRPCTAAGMFTSNKVPGAPVIVSRRHVRGGKARAIVVNSGCSNVATGKRGEADALTMCQAVGKHVGCPAGQVLVCSTGVIGRFLPMEKIIPGIGQQFARLQSGEATDAEVATAILTTDLVTKTASRQVKIGKSMVRLAGIAKGSGMIQPNMATMLAFITTDAAIDAAFLRAALKKAVTSSFNRISVDHDTSTSDSVMVLASGLAGNATISRADLNRKKVSPRDVKAFAGALEALCKDLAYQVVKDGEGATKVFRVKVTGARTQQDADRVGYTIAGSPLVKTAVHGADPNWGRLAAAVGRSGAMMKPEKLTITIGGIRVFVKGVNADADLGPLEEHMRGKEIAFHLDLGLGKFEAEWLGCDLSKEYITINADYTT